MRDFAARFLGRRRTKKRDVAESVIRDQPHADPSTSPHAKRPPRNPVPSSARQPHDPVKPFHRKVFRFIKGGKQQQNAKNPNRFNHRVPKKSSTVPIGNTLQQQPTSKIPNPRLNSLPVDSPLGSDRVVTFREPHDEQQDGNQSGDDSNDSPLIPKPASPIKKHLAFAHSSPDDDAVDVNDDMHENDDEDDFFANFTRRDADARNDLPSSPGSPRLMPSNHISTQRPVSNLRFKRRNRSNIPPASQNSINPSGKPPERFMSDMGVKSKSTFSTPAVPPSNTPANQTTDSLDSDQPLLETKATNELLKSNSDRTRPNLPAKTQDAMNITRSNSLMSKQNAPDLELQDLRASLSTPQLSVMKQSTECTSNSFWFAERRKPKSRLLSGFPFRKSSRMFSDYEIPPSIANTPQIPWSVPGAMSEDEDDNEQTTVHPSISNSFLSFRVFNNLRKNNSYVPPTPNTSQEQFSVIEASYPNGTTENGNLKGVRSILRFPFGGRRSPVPTAARIEATAAEDGFEKEIAEKNERPSDISLNIPHMGDDETSFKSAVDPHDFDVDEYSSLHSAISAMLTENSHVVARHQEDEMLMRHDIKLKQPSSKGVLFEQEAPQIRAGVVRYKSTPRENPSACAFSGPVLAFSLLPARPIEVPPAPLVYGPDTTGWPHAFSDFSDPHGTTIGSISLVNENPTAIARDLSDKTVTPPETPVLHLRNSKSPSDEALVPGNTSYVRVSSAGMISNASEKRLGLMDFSIDPVTRVKSNVIGLDSSMALDASYSIPLRSTNESLEDPGLSNQISVPRQSPPPVVNSNLESGGYPVAFLMDESEEITALKSNPPLFTTPTADSPNLLVAPTLADVQKQVAETRRKSELQSVLLDSLRPSTLPDVVPPADLRSNGGSSLHISGAVPTPSEPTFTTFSETSKDWGSLEFASDVPSLSSNEMFVDAPSNLFRSSRNGIERLELPHAAELGSPPSQNSALKSPLLATVIQQSKTQERPSRISKVGIVGPSTWREPRPVPRANTATVLSALPPRPAHVPTPITTPKQVVPAPSPLKIVAPVAAKTAAPGASKPAGSNSVLPTTGGTKSVTPVASQTATPVASKPAAMKPVLAATDELTSLTPVASEIAAPVTTKPAGSKVDVPAPGALKIVAPVVGEIAAREMSTPAGSKEVMPAPGAWERVYPVADEIAAPAGSKPDGSKLIVPAPCALKSVTPVLGEATSPVESRPAVSKVVIPAPGALKSVTPLVSEATSPVESRPDGPKVVVPTPGALKSVTSVAVDSAEPAGWEVVVPVPDTLQSVTPVAAESAAPAVSKVVVPVSDALISVTHVTSERATPGVSKPVVPHVAVPALECVTPVEDRTGASDGSKLDVPAPGALKSVTFEAKAPVESKAPAGSKAGEPARIALKSGPVAGKIGAPGGSTRVVLPPFIIGTPMPVVPEIVPGLSKPAASTEDVPKPITTDNATGGESATAKTTAGLSENRDDTDGSAIENVLDKQ